MSPPPLPPGDPTRSWLSAALVWRTATLVLCAVGLLTNAWGLPFLSTQTNLLVLGYLAGALYWMVRRRSSQAPAPVLRGATAVAIVFVGLISHWFYAGGENPLPGLVVADPAACLVNWSAFLIHWVVPGMMLIDWVAFGPHRVVTWRRALWWIAFPLGYAAVIIARSILFPHVWARYPIEFLDPSRAGWAGVLGAILPLAALVAVLAAAMWCLDWLVGARRHPDPATRSQLSLGRVTADTLLDEQAQLLRQGDSSALASRYRTDAQIIHADGVAEGRSEIEALFAAQAALEPTLESISEAGRSDDCVGYRAVVVLGGDRIHIVGTFVLRDGQIWRQTTIPIASAA